MPEKLRRALDSAKSMSSLCSVAAGEKEKAREERRLEEQRGRRQGCHVQSSSNVDLESIGIELSANPFLREDGAGGGGGGGGGCGRGEERTGAAEGLAQ